MTTQLVAFGPTWTRTYLQSIFSRIAPKSPAAVAGMIAATEAVFARRAAFGTEWAIDKGEVLLGDNDEGVSSLESLREGIIDQIWKGYLTKTRSLHRKRARVVPGEVVLSTGATSAALYVEATRSLARHLGADWGDWPNRDKMKNDCALLRGGSVLSRYALSNGDALFIFTERDSNVTKMYLASDVHLTREPFRVGAYPHQECEATAG